MFAQERYQAILKILTQRKRLHVSEVQNFLKISSATLRRDLAEMENAGMIVRVHGGILHRSFLGEPTFAQKEKHSMEAKRAIANEVANLVPDGATLFIDSGTTCLEVGRRLLPRKDLTLITNSVPLLQLSLDIMGANIISIGGNLRKVSGALTGSVFLKWMETVHADISVISASGLSQECGVSTTELDEAAVKKTFLALSRQKILAADKTKWNAPSTIKFGDWNDFSVWVTDTELTRDEKNSLGKQSLKIIKAKANEA